MSDLDKVSYATVLADVIRTYKAIVAAEEPAAAKLLQYSQSAFAYALREQRRLERERLKLAPAKAPGK